MFSPNLRKLEFTLINLLWCRELACNTRAVSQGMRLGEGLFNAYYLRYEPLHSSPLSETPN